MLFNIVKACLVNIDCQPGLACLTCHAFLASLTGQACLACQASQVCQTHSLLKSLTLYQALLKYIPHHWGTLWGGELLTEDWAGGHNFLPGFTKCC